MINPNYTYTKLVSSLAKLRETWNGDSELETLLQTIETELHESLVELSEFKRVLDQSTIVAITDLSGVILYANDKFCEISKYTKEELIGENHRMLNSGYHDRSFFKNMWATISDGKIWSDELKNKAKDGSYYWVKTTIIPLLDKHGKPYQYISLRTDITKGKIVEEKYRESLRYEFESTIDAIHNFVYKLKCCEDGSYKYTLFKGGLARELELYSENTVGKTPNEVFDSETAQNLNKSYKQAFSGESVTFTFQYKGGSYHTTLSPIEVNGVVVEVVGSVSDITDLIKAESLIFHMAYHDPLTNLMNRRKFIENLSQAIEHAEANHEKVAVMFLDLDRFKQINDSLGHSVGDKLLTAVTHRLQNEVLVNQNCSLYRVGGDEFIILVPDVKDEVEISCLAKKILALFTGALYLDEQEFFITASVGISLYPENGTNGEELMKNADTAMYYAKNHGRNTFKLYTPEMNAKYNEHLMLEVELRKAIKNNELYLVYQPKVDIRTGEMVGMEALLRWNHATLGYVSPATFIPIAEETGFIVTLGEWVLHTACLQNKKWIDEGYEPMRISVNVSALQFQRVNFIETVRRVIQSTGIDPNYVELEITENSIMDNTEECIETLAKVRELGITISIDDFGTGYSSLSYLKRFPINTLKIDQSFVRDVMADPDDVAIVKAIINLAHNLNLQVIAEGVETQEVFDFLCDQQCDQIQGYYISMPLTVDDFRDLLEKQLKKQSKSIQN
ncbi:sensor domain-containing protein [Brevibacillus sp. SYSU BS000544]|uniref:sensor domain-containing protein n=1 Tax=Brevibacillus sp. SYSU BS000544 TaxID=3416443 RepID=UPI003CE53F5F